MKAFSRSQIAAFSLCLYIMGKRQREWYTIHRNTNHIVRDLLSRGNHPPKAASPNSITLQDRISTYEFGVIQTFGP